jgi:hypothetical protein
MRITTSMGSSCRMSAGRVLFGSPQYLGRKQPPPLDVTFDPITINHIGIVRDILKGQGMQVADARVGPCVGRRPLQQHDCCWQTNHSKTMRMVSLPCTSKDVRMELQYLILED